MLARQTAIYFASNIFSAIFGFLNVVVFTRMFAMDAYGHYVLGFAFAVLFATLLSTALKLSILRHQARGDEDVRALILAGAMLGLVLVPVGFVAALAAGLSAAVAGAAVVLAYVIALFDTSLEMLRAQQKALHFMRGTVYRALFVSVFGIGVAFLGSSGLLLLGSTALAVLAAVLMVWRMAWGGAKPQFDRAKLKELFVSGLPVTLSMSLLALSSVLDRFVLVHFAGAAAGGQFGASLDLVRQGLIIPAISVASAFVPAAVQALARGGEAEARAHLNKYLEILLATALPACVGLALVSPLVADFVLGPDFRAVAHQAMPILSIAVIFQILTQQYLHTSFLLSNRNLFYFANTGSIIVFNLLAAIFLMPLLGIMGAVWGRLATEIFGFLNALVLSRYAFALPVFNGAVMRIAGAAALMALVVFALLSPLKAMGPLALLIIIPAGMAVYAAAVWLLDIGEARKYVNWSRIFPKRGVSAGEGHGL